MRTTILRAATAAWLLALTTTPARAVDTSDSTFLHEPDVAAGRIVFVYADDLWTARPDGSDVRRLTAHPGTESSPHFSPDGRLIAFTAAYDGNVDAFVIPASGGEPTRLTAHPGDDIVRGFAPDGSVLFSSQREVFTGRFSQFFTVGTEGGFPKKLPVPSGDRAEFSPDGKFLAYTPIGERFRQWKNYRGGTASRIWVLTMDGLGVEQVPQPEGRCNDTYPMWVGDTVYFLSDRAGEFNLFAFDRAAKRITQLTRHDDFPVESASAGAGKIIYEQAGHLYVFDPVPKVTERLRIGVASDQPETRERLVGGAKSVREADLSPTGKRAVFGFRGEIVTVPARKGDVRNLTRTTGVHERSPAWSPDGKSIAYFSDTLGEYALMVEAQDDKGEPRSYTLRGSGFYERPAWSPDSKKIAFIDSSRTLSWIDLASGKVTEVDSEPIYGPENTLKASWSPDSKWLAYTLTNKAYFRILTLYALDEGVPRKLTDGLAEVAEPVFDAGGKYLYFLASTDAGPVKQWFDQSNADMRATYSVYLATLAKATPNPLLKESDEEPIEEVKGEGSKGQDEKGDKEKKGEKAKDVVVDLDGIEGRILPLPIPAGGLSDLAAGKEGEIYYLRRVGMVVDRGGDDPAGKPTLERFTLKDRKEETLAEKVDAFRLSFDAKKILYQSKDTWGIADAGKFEVGKDRLPVESISVRIVPRDEWPQIFQEAWRINRDYFYATNYHGADWSALREKYAKFLPEVPTREDLNWVIRMLCSELSVGHSRVGGGDRLYEPKSIPVGLLGADFEIADGRYRFKKIYGGLNWDTQLKAPLVAPGVDVKEGEYLLGVDGQDLKSETEVYRRFENKVGRRVELKVSPRPDGTDARTVTVELIGNESALRNRAWVEGNVKKVRERTGGKVAYVYVPNTASQGHASFKRYFFPQVGADAIIVDERFNGGGQVADYYIDLLRRPLVSYWAMRHGDALRTPGAAIPGPKVMIIDETAGSGGDMLPWMFRKLGVGKLVGRRTWGGLVGTLGFPVLMDGGRVTAPDLAIFTEDGWVVENEGVPPDIEVEQLPAEVAVGKDPQLERAIGVALEGLKQNPPKSIERPPFPIRVRRAREEVAR